MQDFIVITVSFHDNIIKHTRVAASTKLQAMRQVLLANGADALELSALETEEDLKNDCFNGDLLIEAIPLNELSNSWRKHN